MFSYLRFLLKSTNQHGVHSPFVYNYLTKGVYKKNMFKYVQSKTNQWILQSIEYFNPNEICFLDNGLSVVARELHAKKSIELIKADLILDRYNSENEQQILATIQQMDANQLLLLGLYTYPEDFMNQLRNLPEITLVVDFYCGCLISKRTEQQKQNFFIRY